MRRILEGVRVLDLSQFFSGPQATLFLAGLGAEVIRIDSPAMAASAPNAPPYAGPKGVTLDRATPDDICVNYLKRTRAKKAMCIDLKRPEGVALFHRLAEASDVVLENFSVGVANRLGVGYDALKARNPRLIYCALTGYGSTGPDRHIKAYDFAVQAAAGLMSITGIPGQAPVKAGAALSDAIAGTFAMSGVMAALYDRERTGKGQFIDVSMVDCLFSLIFDDPIDWYEEMGLPMRQGSRIMRFSPINAYETTDGWIVAGAASPDQWRGLLAAMGRAEGTRELAPPPRARHVPDAGASDARPARRRRRGRVSIEVQRRRNRLRRARRPAPGPHARGAARRARHGRRGGRPSRGRRDRLAAAACRLH